MFQYSKGNLPVNFDVYFNPTCNTHLYNTRVASRSFFSLPLIRMNYGLFDIRFCGPKLWNNIDELLKSLTEFSFKKEFKNQIITFYKNQMLLYYVVL